MDHHPLADAIGPLLDATGADVVPVERAEPGDIVLHWDGEPVVAVRLAHLGGELERMIDSVERELGCPLLGLDREGKQTAVAMLNSRGAFHLRKSVEDVASALGVSRFTVYNYLDRVGA